MDPSLGSSPFQKPLTEEEHMDANLKRTREICKITDGKTTMVVNTIDFRAGKYEGFEEVEAEKAEADEDEDESVDWSQYDDATIKKFATEAGVSPTGSPDEVIARLEAKGFVPA